MRTVIEIYEKYRLMPSLHLHQLRVAAVGKLMCGIHPQVNERTVVLAALFHDMGNIIKSDLAVFPDFLEPKGLAYWQDVKDDFIRTYGPNPTDATQAIIAEIGLPQDVIDAISHLSFSEIQETVAEGPLERKIAKYADMRVGPHGVVPLQERLLDLKARYSPLWAPGEVIERDKSFKKNSELLIQLEEELFFETASQPEDINDATIAPIIEELRNYSL